MGARHIAWRQERRMHATDSKQCIRAANEMDSTSIGLCPQGVRILSVSKLPLQGSATEKWLPQPWRMHCIRQLSLRGFDRRGGVIWGRGGGSPSLPRVYVGTLATGRAAATLPSMQLARRRKRFSKEELQTLSFGVWAEPVG